MDLVINKAADIGISVDDSGSPPEPVSRGGNRQETLPEPMENLAGESLLKTIKVPANLANLSIRLPKSNY